MLNTGVFVYKFKFEYSPECLTCRGENVKSFCCSFTLVPTLLFGNSFEEENHAGNPDGGNGLIGKPLQPW